MGCGDKQMMAEIAAWSGQVTATTMFVLGGPTLETKDFESVKVDLESRDETGNVKWNRAIAYGDDGINWDAASTFDDDSGTSWISDNGFDYGTEYQTITSSKRYFRLGIGARNESVGDVECVRCTMTIALTPR